MPLTDRRQGARFDFVGGQWGSVHELEPLSVRNFGLAGLLIESATPLPVGSIHTIQLMYETQTAQCYAAVRHLSPGDEAGTELPYLIGLEFIDLAPHAASAIAAFIDDVRQQRATAQHRATDSA
jgi:hypothetical protein